MGGKSSSKSSSQTYNTTTSQNAGNLTSNFDFSGFLGTPTLNLGGTITNAPTTTQTPNATTNPTTNNTSNTESSSSAKAGGALEGLGSGLGIGFGGGTGMGSNYNSDTGGAGTSGSGSALFNNATNGVGLSSNMIFYLVLGIGAIALMNGSDKKKKKDN